MRLASPVLLFVLHAAALPASETYDPLALPLDAKTQTVDLTVHDKSRNRDLPLRVYLPVASSARPVVLFSHGLGGNCKGSAFLGKHWSARGYVAVFVQHPGSDDSLWRDQPLAKRMSELRKGASAANFLLRVQDVPAALDQLAKWNDEKDHPLAGRLDLEHVGMSGHSFGGVTTEAVSGQALPTGRQPYTDARIKAAIVFSPSSPRRGDPKRAFSKVKLPWLLMTGTLDTALIGDQTVETRLAVYPALPAGDKYQLVLDKAEHSAFTDRALPGDRQARNPNHHRAILAISTAFWDTYLEGNAEAKAWLAGSGPRGVLEEADQWETK